MRFLIDIKHVVNNYKDEYVQYNFILQGHGPDFLEDYTKECLLGSFKGPEI